MIIILQSRFSPHPYQNNAYIAVFANLSIPIRPRHPLVYLLCLLQERLPVHAKIYQNGVHSVSLFHIIWNNSPQGEGSLFCLEKPLPLFRKVLYCTNLEQQIWHSHVGCCEDDRPNVPPMAFCVVPLWIWDFNMCKPITVLSTRFDLSEEIGVFTGKTLAKRWCPRIRWVGQQVKHGYGYSSGIYNCRPWKYPNKNGVKVINWVKRHSSGSLTEGPGTDGVHSATVPRFGQATSLRCRYKRPRIILAESHGLCSNPEIDRNVGHLEIWGKLW